MVSTKTSSSSSTFATGAVAEMLKRTNTPEARCYIVEGNDMAHLLQQIPYEDAPQETVQLPERRLNPDYERHELPPELFVPRVYG